MELVAFLLVFASVNFVLSMLIQSFTGEKGVWFTRYTLFSFKLLVLLIVLYFILD